MLGNGGSHIIRRSVEMYRLPNIIKVIKLGKVSLVIWHTCDMREISHMFLLGKHEKKNHTEELGVDGRTTLR